MPHRAYHFGLLVVVFGGFLLLGRGLFAADSNAFGTIGLVIMALGLAAGVAGLIDESA